MSKATPAEVEALGFIPETFSFVAGSEWNAYLQTILDGVALELEDAVGATTYASTTPLVALRVKRMETLLAGAELWNRAEAVFLRDQNTGDGGRSYAPSEWAKKRSSYLDEIDVLLARFGLAPWPRSAEDAPAGPVSSSVVSSHFATDQEG
jgi:hypothetical protein